MELDARVARSWQTTAHLTAQLDSFECEASRIVDALGVALERAENSRIECTLRQANAALLLRLRCGLVETLGKGGRGKQTTYQILPTLCY